MGHVAYVEISHEWIRCNDWPIAFTPDGGVVHTESTGIPCPGRRFQTLGLFLRRNADLTRSCRPWKTVLGGQLGENVGSFTFKGDHRIVFSELHVRFTPSGYRRACLIIRAGVSRRPGFAA